MEDKIDYQAIVEKHPWTVEMNQKCILSPDANGLLSGLLMTHYLSWDVVGFYNGKELRIKEGVLPKDCIFVDVEIFRSSIRSIGHHMIAHNNNNLPKDYHERLKNCVNPNYIRGFDRIHHFGKKYPLGTAHLLLFILSYRFSDSVSIKENGFGPIFFADGIWKILFKYTANFLDWFEYLQVNGNSEWWDRLKSIAVIELIREMEKLFAELRKMHPSGKSWWGHILNERGLNPIQEKQLTLDLIKFFGTKTGWTYDSKRWHIENLITKKFTKEIFNESKSNISFLQIWEKNPISFAMTRGSDIEYTLEKPDSL